MQMEAMVAMQEAPRTPVQSGAGLAGGQGFTGLSGLGASPKVPAVSSTIRGGGQLRHTAAGNRQGGSESGAASTQGEISASLSSGASSCCTRTSSRRPIKLDECIDFSRSHAPCIGAAKHRSDGIGGPSDFIVGSLQRSFPWQWGFVFNNPWSAEEGAAAERTVIRLEQLLSDSGSADAQTHAPLSSCSKDRGGPFRALASAS